MEEAREERAEKREVQKQRKFDKKVKGLHFSLFPLHLLPCCTYVNIAHENAVATECVNETIRLTVVFIMNYF